MGGGEMARYIGTYGNEKIEKLFLSVQWHTLYAEDQW
jgi:hypothetical protein